MNNCARPDGPLTMHGNGGRTVTRHDGDVRRPHVCTGGLGNSDLATCAHATVAMQRDRARVVVCTAALKRGMPRTRAALHVGDLPRKENANRAARSASRLFLLYQHQSVST